MSDTKLDPNALGLTGGTLSSDSKNYIYTEDCTVLPRNSPSGQTIPFYGILSLTLTSLLLGLYYLIPRIKRKKHLK